MASSGEELLIADMADRDREGLRQLFEAEGYVCTAVNDVAAARDIIRRKFFPVVLIDLDFGGTGGGIELVQYVQQHSSPTRIVMLAGRRSFETAVEALRAGVVDVVTKRPDQVQHLLRAVQRAIDRYRAGDKDSDLLREVRGVLDEAFKIMLGLSRKVHSVGGSSGASLTMKPTILIIDEDQAFLQQVAGLLQDKPWEVAVEMSGGSGLDKASTFSFQIIAVRAQLMDLPGHMLIKSAQVQKTATLGLLYDAVAGRVERYEGGHITHSQDGFDGPQHLVRELDKIVGELGAMREERRHLQALRTEHGNFLKRYAELKSRIDAVSD